MAGFINFMTAEYIYVISLLFAGWEVRIVKNCVQGFENAARVRPPAAFSSPRSQFFTIRTDPKPVNNFFFSKLSNEKKNARKKNSRKEIG